MTISPDVTFAKRFVQDERTARENGSGLWKSGASKTNDDKTAAAGKDGSSANPAGDAGSAACSKPSIKGNINAKGQKIYHIPGSSYYNQTKAEVMFCSEEDAAAAGFRKPK
jgi:micrococcal nuclease